MASGLTRQHRKALLTGFVLLVATTCGLSAVHISVGAKTARLQQLADDAAIAGITALMTTEGQSDGDRIDAARSAAGRVTAAAAADGAVLAPSTGERTMSVTLTQNASGRAAVVSAVARYVDPGEPLVDGDRQSSQLILLHGKPTRG